ncbi:response regulator [Pseudoduganella sp. LjRoot289]|uniref:response regulator n=1 Tax=Pseudoduganella sp. LjRoot289 TaxID=3342314 RepID=UPI003ED13C1F
MLIPVNNAAILVIEDDMHIRMVLRTTLEGAGFAVAEATSGASGLAQAKALAPALMLVDLGLPDIDGVELIARLRDFSPAPVIVVSARHQEAEKVAALNAGADDFLTKPFGVAELVARVRAHLRRLAPPAKAGQAAGNFSFGDIVVHAEERLVTRAGEDVHLTPLEYKLLSVLVENAGKVLTHTRLLQQAWGPGYVERVHYLRIHMAHLRRKLEADPAQPRHLLTETGVGYRLRP